MLPTMFGCAEQGSGPAALALSLEPTNVDIIIDTLGQGQSSISGEINVTATASGGTTPYAYAWTLNSENDPTNSYSINMGTTNAANWNDAVISTTFQGPPGPGNDPPPPGAFTIQCEVTDDDGTTTQATMNISVEAQ